VGGGEGTGHNRKEPDISRQTPTIRERDMRSRRSASVSKRLETCPGLRTQGEKNSLQDSGVGDEEEGNKRPRRARKKRYRNREAFSHEKILTWEKKERSLGKVQLGKFREKSAERADILRSARLMRVLPTESESAMWRVTN